MILFGPFDFIMHSSTHSVFFLFFHFTFDTDLLKPNNFPNSFHFIALHSFHSNSFTRLLPFILSAALCSLSVSLLNSPPASSVILHHQPPLQSIPSFGSCSLSPSIRNQKR